MPTLFIVLVIVLFIFNLVRKNGGEERGRSHHTSGFYHSDFGHEHNDHKGGFFDGGGSGDGGDGGSGGD